MNGNNETMQALNGATGGSGGDVKITQPDGSEVRDTSPQLQRAEKRVEMTVGSVSRAVEAAEDEGVKADRDVKDTIRDRIARDLAATADARDGEGLLKNLSGAIANAEANMEARLKKAVLEMGRSMTFIARNLGQVEAGLIERGLQPSGKGALSDIVRGGIHVGGVYVPTYAILLDLLMARATRFHVSDNPEALKPAFSLTDALMAKGNPFVMSDFKAYLGDGEEKIRANLVRFTVVRLEKKLQTSDAQGVWTDVADCKCASDLVLVGPKKWDVTTKAFVELKENSDDEFVLPKADPATEIVNTCVITPVFDVAAFAAGVTGLRELCYISEYNYYTAHLGRIIASPDIKAWVEIVATMGLAGWNKTLGILTPIIMPIAEQFVTGRASPLIGSEDVTAVAKLRKIFDFENK